MTGSLPALHSVSEKTTNPEHALTALMGLNRLMAKNSPYHNAKVPESAQIALKNCIKSLKKSQLMNKGSTKASTKQEQMAQHGKEFQQSLKQFQELVQLKSELDAQVSMVEEQLKRRQQVEVQLKTKILAQQTQKEQELQRRHQQASNEQLLSFKLTQLHNLEQIHQQTLQANEKDFHMEIKMREYYQSELMALRNKIMNFGQTLAWKEELLLLIENLRHSKEVLEEEVKVLQKEYLQSVSQRESLIMAVVGKRIEERRECIKSKCERHLPALRAIATTDDKKTIEDKLALYQIRSDDYFTRRGLQKACDFKQGAREKTWEMLALFEKIVPIDPVFQQKEDQAECELQQLRKERSNLQGKLQDLDRILKSKTAQLGRLTENNKMGQGATVWQ